MERRQTLKMQKGDLELKKTQDLQKALDELKKMNVLKEEFSSMISHELKTPLIPIKGHCEILSEAGVIGELNSKQLHSVKEIERNANRLQRLISDILDVQKLDIGKMIFNKEKFEVGEFLYKVEHDLSVLMKEKEIEFVIKNSQRYNITSDETRLHQVIDNLIKNAVDFVPQKIGIIEIGTHREDGKVIFYVKDNGFGIPQEQHKNLFKKFYQIDTSHTRKHGGTGLGLVICKGIVEGLGGEIWFESDEGKGATFYFSIPLEQKIKIQPF